MFYYEPFYFSRSVERPYHDMQWGVGFFCNGPEKMKRRLTGRLEQAADRTVDVCP